MLPASKGACDTKWKPGAMMTMSARPVARLLSIKVCSMAASVGPARDARRQTLARGVTIGIGTGIGIGIGTGIGTGIGIRVSAPQRPSTPLQDGCWLNKEDTQGGCGPASSLALQHSLTCVTVPPSLHFITRRRATR